MQDVLSFCDYLASGESSTDVSNRLQALLGAKAELSQVSLTIVLPAGLDSYPAQNASPWHAATPVLW